MRNTICTAKRSCKYRASTRSMMASMVSCGTARRGSPGTQVSTLIACMNDAQKVTVGTRLFLPKTQVIQRHNQAPYYATPQSDQI